MGELCSVSLQLVRHLAYLLSGQGQYDEALKLGKEVRSKLELAFSFEASDRLNELERIMKEYVTFCTCTWNIILYELTYSISEERAEKMRQEEERIREQEEMVAKELEKMEAELMMLNYEERMAGRRRSIPKAPPPPPVVELDEEAFQWQDNGEFENIVLDTGMHTVKVGEVSCIDHEICLLCSL